MNRLSNLIAIFVLVCCVSDLSVEAQNQDYKALKKEFFSLIQAYKYLGKERDFGMGYSPLTGKEKWGKDTIDERKSVARMIRYHHKKTEPGLREMVFQKKDKFVEYLNAKFIDPCRKFVAMRGDVLEQAKADMTEKGYSYIGNLCRKLQIQDEVEEIYKVFKTECRILDEKFH